MVNKVALQRRAWQWLPRELVADGQAWPALSASMVFGGNAPRAVMLFRLGAEALRRLAGVGAAGWSRLSWPIADIAVHRWRCRRTDQWGEVYVGRARGGCVCVVPACGWLLYRWRRMPLRCQRHRW